MNIDEHDVQSLDTFTLPEGFRGKKAVYVQLWWFVQSTFFAWSPQILYGWRRWLLRLFGADIGKNVLIRPTVKVTYPWKVSIGDSSWVGDDVTLYSLGEIEIGKNTVISQRSYICTGTHNYQKISFPIEVQKVHINDQVWIATDVFVAPGVTIGAKSVVGTRSSVFTDLPPSMVCYGSPAKPVKSRIG